MALQAEPDVPDESGGGKDKDYLLVRKLKSDVSPRGSKHSCGSWGSYYIRRLK